jgi:NAD(P)-dependent dehydrogenase (short-subunit alcohol dehydrogenase family)
MMKRFGQPDEVAATVGFLRPKTHRTSPESRSTWTADSGRSEDFCPMNLLKEI